MQTPDVFERASELLRRQNFPSAADFSHLVLDDLVARLDLCPCHPLLDHLLAFTELAYELDGFAGLPDPPEFSDGIDGASYRGHLMKIINRIVNPNALRVAKDTLVASFSNFRYALPAVALQHFEDVLAVARGERAIASDVELLDIVPDIATAVERLTVPFFSEEARSSNIFEEVREQLDFNRHKASGLMLVPGYVTTSQKITKPSEYDGTAAQVVAAYLSQTQLDHLFYIRVPGS